MLLLVSSADTRHHGEAAMGAKLGAGPAVAGEVCWPYYLRGWQLWRFSSACSLEPRRGRSEEERRKQCIWWPSREQDCWKQWIGSTGTWLIRLTWCCTWILKCHRWTLVLSSQMPRADSGLFCWNAPTRLSPRVTLMSFPWVFKLLLSSNSQLFHSLSYLP